MAMTFDIVRRPRTRQTPSIIRQELMTTYRGMEPDIQRDYEEELRRRGWKGEIPKFTMDISITGKTYRMGIKVDRRTNAGKKFLWSDKGTMDEGNPATTYPIDVVDADFLVFDVPYQPQTMPFDGGLNYDPAAQEHTVRTLHVDHPGIKPRRFSQAVKALYKQRTYRKGFYRKTENAYRRGFRKAKRMGQL